MSDSSIRQFSDRVGVKDFSCVEGKPNRGLFEWVVNDQIAPGLNVGFLADGPPSNIYFPEMYLCW